MRASLIQICVDPAESVDARRDRAVGLIRERSGSDLVVLPELWTTGAFAFDQFGEHAEELRGPTFLALSEAARDAGVWLHGGSIPEHDSEGRLYNTSLVFAPDGTLAGYAQVDVVRPGRLHADGYTRPGHLGTGIGAALIDWSGDRARRLAATAPHAGAPATLLHYVMLDGAADRMLRARDYRFVRVHQRMRRSLTGPLPAPRWPEGVTVRPCDGTPEELRRVHACAEEAFADRYEGWAAPSSGGAPTWSTSGPTRPCGSSPSAPGGSSASPSAT